MKAPESSSAGNKSVVRAAAVMVFAAVLAYSNSFSVPFMYDDFENIERNLNVTGPRGDEAATGPSSEAQPIARPIAQWSFRLNYALGGLNPVGYHAVNLLIHVLAGLALFGIVRRTLAGKGLAERFAPHATPVALVVALLWMLHPLNTESVTYIVHRYESLMGLLFFATLYFAIRGFESKFVSPPPPGEGQGEGNLPGGRSSCGDSKAPSPRPSPGGRGSIGARRGFESGRWGWLAASVVACACGMATKERMVMAPLIVLLYDRAFAAGGFRDALKSRRWFYLGLAATWGVLAAVVLHATAPGGTGFGVTPLDYARIQIPAVVHYLKLAFWPHPLALHAGFPYVNDHPALPAMSEVIPSLVLLLALLAATIAAIALRPKWGFLLAWFFLWLAPSSSVIPNWEAVEEHHTYLPLAGIVALVVGSFYLALRTPAGRKVGVALAAAAAIALGAGTYLRNVDYESNVSIWADTVSKRALCPRAWFNLGAAYLHEGQYAESVPCFDNALALDSHYMLAHYNAGYALARLGQYDKAESRFRAALKLEANFAPAEHYLGVSLAVLGRVDEAIGCFRRAIDLDPHYVLAHNDLGAALMRRGKLDDAIACFRKAIALDPRSAVAHFNLGAALLKQGKVNEAVSSCEEAVRLDPASAPYLLVLSEAYAEAGRFDDAMSAVKKAMDIAAASKQNQLYESVREHLAKYAARQPWKETVKP